MKRVVASNIVAAALLVLSSSCAVIQTSPKRGTASLDTETILPVPSGRGSEETAGVLLSYEFTGDGAIKGGECRWRVINQDTKKSYFLTLDTEKTSAFAPLAPGTYKTAKLGCGLTKVWDLDDTFGAQGFKVQPGSASYLGKVNFVFVTGDLAEVKKGSRSDSADAFSAASENVPNGMPVVSAFTLAPVDRGIATEASSHGFDIHAQGLQGPILDELATQLKGCSTNDHDSLKMGHLDYTASYKAGKFVEFKNQKDSGSFSSELRKCVSDTMTGFLPTSKGAVEIHVAY